MTGRRPAVVAAVAAVVLAVAGGGILAANPDMRAAAAVRVDPEITRDRDDGLRVPCVGADAATGTGQVALAVRNNGLLPVTLAEPEQLAGRDGAVATVGYRSGPGDPRPGLTVRPGGAFEVILTLTIARCGPGNDRSTTTTIRQVTLPVRTFGVASSVVLELPQPVRVPGEIDITPDNPFGC